MTAAIPDSRSYIHQRCGRSTEVSESEFGVVANPFPGCRMTMCCACGQHFPVAEFTWEDSGERIVDYYARHAARASLLTRSVASRPFGLALIALGAIAGVALAIAVGQWLGIIVGILVGIIGVPGGMIAALLTWSSLEHRLVSSALGVADVRCLR